MSKAAIAIAFIFGATAGSVTAWYFTKKTYEQIAQQEIDSVKETFSKLYKRDDSVCQDAQDASDEEPEDEEDPDKEEYAAIAEQEGYIKHQDPGKVDKYEPPYVIPPESFDELEGYDTCGLTYYVDGTLVDDNDDIIEDLVGVTGFATTDELESHFGEYEDDSIFVRND
ncbi:MAG: hypothetical protein II207_01010, partial [Clostridia bacterium]|nr:hypothetical protein [Clostridia bacterium]